MPGSVPASVLGSAARVCAWLLCLPFQLFHFSSSPQAGGAYRSSLITASQILTPPQSSRKTPATARKAVLTPPPPGKAHTSPQRASHRRCSLSPLMPKRTVVRWIVGSLLEFLTMILSTLACRPRNLMMLIKTSNNHKQHDRPHRVRNAVLAAFLVLFYHGI